MILKYMHGHVASSSSEESLGEADNEEALHERLLVYEATKNYGYSYGWKTAPTNQMHEKKYILSGKERNKNSKK